MTWDIVPSGEIFVGLENQRVLGRHNAFGRVVLDDWHANYICCSPTGVLYVLTVQGVQKLEGSRLQTLMAFESLAEDLQGTATTCHNHVCDQGRGDLYS